MRPGGIMGITPDMEEVAVSGFDTSQIDYHLSQIAKAGFIDEGGMQPMYGIGFRSLTWQGHEFLDSVRDPAIWSATKDGAKKAGGFSIELLGALAKGLIKKNLEDHTGIKLDF